MHLRDRYKFPPGGFRFMVAETKWSISPWISFDAAVGQIIQHRQANPYLTKTKNWSLDPGVVAEELDQYNTAVCQQMGWKAYISDGGPDPGPPKVLSPQLGLSRSAQLAAGIKTISEWEIAGGNVVAVELANKRARTCTECPFNSRGDLLTFFTEAAAHLIKLQLETKNKMKLVTDFDPLLGVCDDGNGAGCFCVNKLSVWCPIDIKRKHMKPEVFNSLHPNCWVRHE